MNLEQIKRQHRQTTYRGMLRNGCVSCPGQLWPCQTAALLALVEAQSARVEELEAALRDALDYADRHRVSFSNDACNGRCHEEWCLVRDSARVVLGASLPVREETE